MTTITNDGAWTKYALSRSQAFRVPMTEQDIENLAECALGPTRGDDRLRHLEHVAFSDVPRLIREIVRLREAAT